MSTGQLAGLLAERAQWVAGRPDATPETGDGGVSVLVVLRSLHLADVVDGARRFAAGLGPAEATAWRESWTRTRFLFGNPANLGLGTRTAAWLGPFPHARLPGPARLLKPVTGRLPDLPPDLDVPGTGARRVLRVAVGGLTLVDYLVHLHHTLAEAVLLGRLRPDEPLRLCHRPSLGTGEDTPAYARVLPEPDGLRLHTWLSAAGKPDQ
jgi:uncharacterized protein DUF6182